MKVDGWRDIDELKPKDFELVHILVGEKVVHAWWTGQVWDGRKDIDGTKVTAWKYPYSTKKRRESLK